MTAQAQRSGGIAELPPAARELNGPGDPRRFGQAPGAARRLPARPFRPARSSEAQRCCPWGVRSPRGEFLREGGRLKIVGLGSRPVFVLRRPAPAPSLSARSGPEGSLSWAAPLSFAQTQPPRFPLPMAPWTPGAKRDEELGASARADTRDGGGGASGPLQPLVSDWRRRTGSVCSLLSILTPVYLL